MNDVDRDATTARLRRRALVDFLGVWTLFLAYSWLHAPPPATGEPHYLSKARHFHDPAWCQGDLFLESVDTHVAFHLVFGWPTRFVSPEATILYGRVVGLGITALGWTALARTLVRNRRRGETPCGVALGSAAVYCVFASTVNLSGEWMLDGIEGRVVGYGFLFLGWAAALNGRSIGAAASLGAAIAFHPVVGGWGLTAGIGGWLLLRLAVRDVVPPATSSSSVTVPTGPRKGKRSDAARWLIVATAFLLPASLGVVPALRAVGGGHGPQADDLQVFYRLAHHLDPTTFDRRAWIACALILTGWLIARRWEPAVGSGKTPGATSDQTAAPDAGSFAVPASSGRTVHQCPVDEGATRSRPIDPRRWWLGCVLSSLLIFVTGVAAGWGPRPATEENFPFKTLRTRFLKFYPFRLADTLVPVAAAFTLTTLAARAFSTRPRAGRAMAVATISLTIAVALGNGWRTRVRPPIAPWRVAAWKEACRWVRDHAPPNAVFITPQVSWGFKWFAERPEYVTYKDCPQDPASLVEWNRRLLLLDAWATEENRDGFSVDALRRLRRATGATHLLARDLGPFAVAPVWRNEIYQIIELPEG